LLPNSDRTAWSAQVAGVMKTPQKTAAKRSSLPSAYKIETKGRKGSLEPS